jgi:hypothetical protein
MELARQVRAFVDELPREQLPELKGYLEARLWREALAPVVSVVPPNTAGLLSTKAAAALLDCKPDELRDRVRRGDIVAVQDRSGGRYHFEPAELERYRQRHRTRSVANGADLRYMPLHDTPRSATAPPPARLDPAPAGRGAQRDGTDGRPLGARRARRHPAGRDRPYAPGQAAWSDPAPPAPKG